MSVSNKQGFECPKCKNNYSTAYSMYRHMRKVHNCDINRCVTLYCPIENCNESYDRYNALDTHLTRVHYADIRKETFEFSDVSDFEAWLKDITSSSKTKYIKRSCNNAYRYYRCHRSGLPKTSTDKINSMKSSVKIGRHCPSRIIAKITDRNVQVEFVPTHIGHECEIAKIPLSQKKRLDIACRLANSTNLVGAPSVTMPNETHPGPQALHNAPCQPLDQRQQGNSVVNSLNVSNVTTNPRATTSSIMQTDNPLMVTLAPIKTTVPDPQLSLPISQSTHIMQAQLAPQSKIADNNLALMPISPNKQELTARFEQLMSSIRSDKHASIVKAQLEVCFALIRD